MTERDRAAVDVQLLLIDAELFRDREDLRSKCFIDFDEIEIAQFHPGFLERDLRRRNGTDAHDLRITTGDAPRHDAAEWLLAVQIVFRRHRDHRSAVDDSARVARSDESVFRK